jgi:hypothetical protein
LNAPVAAVVLLLLLVRILDDHCRWSSAAWDIPQARHTLAAVADVTSTSRVARFEVDVEREKISTSGGTRIFARPTIVALVGLFFTTRRSIKPERESKQAGPFINSTKSKISTLSGSFCIQRLARLYEP